MNKTYQNMLTAAKERLRDKDPFKIAQNAHIIYDEINAQYLVDSLGKKYVITYPDYECIEEIENWHHLVILHYMDLADGTELNGNLISFANLKDGMIRGTKFDRTVEVELQKNFKNKSEIRIETALKELGGNDKKSKADLCMKIPFLPMYPVTINIWFADDEYPTSGKLLLDKSADHYLTVEDAVTVGDLILSRITNALKD